MASLVKQVLNRVGPKQTQVIFSRTFFNKKDYYYSAHFPKLGLMRDDCISDQDPIHKEAIRRLPKDIAAERQYRISRALYTDSKRQILPKEEWMTLENDILYMAPYIEEVKAEVEEQKQWEKEKYEYRMQRLS